MSAFRGMVASGMVGTVGDKFYVYTTLEGNGAAFHVPLRELRTDDLAFLANQPGFKTSEKIKVIRHETDAVRIEVPCADFSDGSDIQRESIIYLHAIGDELLRRLQGRK